MAQVYDRPKKKGIAYMMLFARIVHDFRDSLKKVRGNAKVVVLSQPFWAVPFNLFNPFMTQYMLAIGLNNEQVGLISSTGLVVGMVLSLFAGYATDRLGRRWALLLFDLVTWCLGGLLWGLSQNFTWCMAAGVANSFLRIVGVPYNCIIVEGTPPEDRLSVYSVLNFSVILANFCAPLMNLLINPLGLVPAMRWVLITSSLLYTTAFVVRHFFFVDTDIAARRKEESKQETPFTALADYRRILRELFKSRALLVMILLRGLFFVQTNLRNTFLSVAIVQGLGFPITIMGFISVITGVCSLLAQLLILPRFAAINARRPLVASFGVVAISNGMLFFAPANHMAILVGAIVINATGLVIILMLIEALTANAMPDGDRASLMALTSIFTVVLSAPFQYLGGILADIPGIGPRLPLLVVITVMMGCMALGRGLRPGHGGGGQ